ncbi:MAG: dihydropteroate synthase [Bacteroidota bacterium]
MNINCNGSLLDLSNPIVMGVINLNTDSFYEGSRISDTTLLLKKVEQMLKQGAEIIDLGAMSSRPGAEIISEEEEANRLFPFLEEILKAFPSIRLSVDTIRASIAEGALQRGACIINDISGGSIDDQLIGIVSKYRAPYILMHMQGVPETMQDDPNYQNVTLEVLDFFIQKVAHIHKMGVNDIILDPGFGFGKTLEHNYKLLQQLSAFKILDLPILVGISRKSMITKALNITTKEALNGTTAAHMLALNNGAKILRAHDVKEAKEAITIYEYYKSGF